MPSFTPLRPSTSGNLAEKISTLLTEAGVPAHQQTTLLTRLCGLSVSQARRKLQGAAWSFMEVAAVMRHLGLPLDCLLDATDEEEGKGGAFNPPANLRLSANFYIEDAIFPCSILLGARLKGEASPGTLLGILVDDAWHVGESRQMTTMLSSGTAFIVTELVVHPVLSNPVRLAFLDDDQTTVDTLTAWFREAGYEATGFSTAEELLAEELQEFDAFVVDYLLAGGESAKETISLIRERFPNKPIVLLTGKLQDGSISESDVVPMLRALNVLLFEKPVRPSVLAAALQNAIDLSQQEASKV